MNQDLKKFIEAVKTDTALQEKLASAGEAYTGDQTSEVVFEKLILPIAQEAGFKTTTAPTLSPNASSASF